MIIVSKVGGGAPKFVNYTHDDEVFGNASSSDTLFTAEIDSFGSPSIIVYKNIVGNEDSIVPRLVTGNEIGHLVLHNLTNGEHALIESVNTAANRITVTTALPGTWQVGDVVTTNSPTVSSVWGFKYFEVDCSEFVGSNVIAALLYVTYLDTASTAGRMVMHPYETEATGKRQAYRLQAINAQFNFTTIIKIVDQRFCFCADFSGVGTGTILFRIVGYWEEG